MIFADHKDLWVLNSAYVVSVKAVHQEQQMEIHQMEGERFWDDSFALLASVPHHHTSALFTPALSCAGNGFPQLYSSVFHSDTQPEQVPDEIHL